MLPIEAIVFDTLQVPPVAPVLESDSVLPMHTLPVPLILPAEGNGFTVAVTVAAPVQRFESVTVIVYIPLADVVAPVMEAPGADAINDAGPLQE